MRALIALRAHTLAFVYGDFEDLDPQHPHIFAYTRTLGSEKYLVVLNFSTDSVAYKLPAGIQVKQLVISNLGKTNDKGDVLHLKAWEARVYKF